MHTFIFFYSKFIQILLTILHDTIIFHIFAPHPKGNGLRRGATRERRDARYWEVLWWRSGRHCKGTHRLFNLQYLRGTTISNITSKTANEDHLDQSTMLSTDFRFHAVEPFLWYSIRKIIDALLMHRINASHGPGATLAANEKKPKSNHKAR